MIDCVEEKQQLKNNAVEKQKKECFVVSVA